MSFKHHRKEKGLKFLMMVQPLKYLSDFYSKWCIISRNCWFAWWLVHNNSQCKQWMRQMITTFWLYVQYFFYWPLDTYGPWTDPSLGGTINPTTPGGGCCTIRYLQCERDRYTLYNNVCNTHCITKMYETLYSCHIVKVTWMMI